MQHFYFDVQSDDDLIDDPDGIPLRDLAAAHLHAVKIVDDCIKHVSSEPVWKGWRVNILDVDRRRRLVVLFRNNVRLRGSGRYVA
ncbi:MAG TPA: hypothetical protein VNQ56_00355 [Pseudolabrys sp.]|nr:hypothetical protein [Pseudolabrys sp.]